MSYSGTFGNLFLAVGLIAWGLLTLVGVGLPGVLVAIWAIVTGLLLLLGK